MRSSCFRNRLLDGELLIGSFAKTPSPHGIEILGQLGFDFVVIDEEHAPFGRGETDVAILAARSTGIEALVRVASASSEHILAALDAGAGGVLVPHVDTPRTAVGIVAAARYRGGTRGYSASGRAGRYGGSSMMQHIADQDRGVCVIAMIEDRQAVARIDDIVAVPGLDAIFVGRADLAVAMEAEGSADQRVIDAVASICAAAKRASKPVCLFVSAASDIAAFRALGASAFIISSDQGFLRQAASCELDAARKAGHP